MLSNALSYFLFESICYENAVRDRVYKLMSVCLDFVYRKYVLWHLSFFAFYPHSILPKF